MSKLLSLLLLCATACLGASTNRITAIVTVTNATFNGSKFTLNANTRTFTNNVTAPLTEITTNATVAGTASNLWFHIVSSGFSGPVQPVGYTNGSNVIFLRGQIGQAMSITLVSNWASVAYSTQVFSAGMIDVRVPIESEAAAVQTNVASLLIQGIDLRTTNRFSTNSVAMLNFASRTNAALYSPSEYSGTYSNAIITNAIRANIDKAVITNAVVGSGSFSNGYVLNALGISGILGSVTNGILQSAKLTNASGDFRNAYGSNWILVDVVVTNFNSPGSGVHSLQVGEFADASGFGAIALGQTATAYEPSGISIGTGANNSSRESVVIGNAAQAGLINTITQSIAMGSSAYVDGSFGTAIGTSTLVSYDYSSAFGYSAEPTTAHQIRLGTASEHVSIPGEIRGVVITNQVMRGTNVLNGRIDFTARTSSSLANGYNSAVIVGSNAYVRFSGPSAAYTNAGFAAPGGPQFVVCQFDNPGLSFTLLNESGLDGTAANRILTGTGALLNSTNNPALATMIYDDGASRWRVLSFR